MVEFEFGGFVFLGAIALGLVHGAEPGHGWPIAATYALDRPNKWWNGLVASTLLGLGHLVSSLAVVALFFLAKSALNVAQLNQPIIVYGHPFGGPIGLVAGVLLILLGLREYRRDYTHTHTHTHGPDSDHSHEGDQSPDHEHGHSHTDGSSHDPSPTREHHHDHGHTSERGWIGRFTRMVPFANNRSHDHPSADELDTKGLMGIVWTAFVLGFVHEEEFEIIGLCLGSEFCLELMLAYAVAVLVALVGLTMVLIAGYYRYEVRLERLADHFPTISAVVLVTMGGGFILGVL